MSETAPLRVRFVVHHKRNRASGVSGATQALGDALERRGCEVSYFHLDDAFGSAAGAEIPRRIRFPWRVARMLARENGALDVVDVTTGDGWVWDWRGRPGNTRAALVTRSHGLEHVMSAELQRHARNGELALSSKYPVYHGGYRLWEVRQSLVRTDAQVFLNEADREFAVRALGVDDSSAVVIPNGISDALLDRAPALLRPADGPIALAFIGSWIPRKGIAAVTRAASILAQRGVPFTLRLLGTSVGEDAVLRDFAPEARAFVSVQPGFQPRELPDLVQGAELLLHPSWTEGFSLALVEGMALELAPVATASGGATSIVRDGIDGVILPDESGESLADAIERLAGDRARVASMRMSAKEGVQQLRWSAIAERTIAVYRAAMQRRAAQIGPA